MMKLALSLVVTLWAAQVAAAGPAPSPFEGGPVSPPHTRIDELVFGRLKQLDIEPAHLCSDAVFVRRAYLDVIGTLPTAREARAFLSDRDPNKRVVLIDRLLERDEFADYWAMKWSDLLRVKSEFPINLWPNAVQAYHRWIRTSIKENVPYDRFVREMLTASGSNFREPQVNFYRAVQSKEPQALAQAVALTFMGVRAENWPKDRRAGLAAFFAQIGYKCTEEWKEEIVFFDPEKAVAASPGGSVKAEGLGDGSAASAPDHRQAALDDATLTHPEGLIAVFPDGTRVQLSPDRDPREVFADWLLAPDNPWFARAIVNRVWSWLLGRGIVHEPDDFRPDNPPGNPELLAYLEHELVAAHYDLKHIYRLILNSQTYQLSSIPRTESPEAVANFAHYPLRRLEAEVLIDALCQITGTTEQYSSPIPEPFTFIPEDQRSIALADGSITSAFLETFGRPPRDTGLETERNNRPTAAQRLHLLNSSHVQRKLEQGPGLRALLQPKGKPGQAVVELYLTILSRFPTAEELKAVQAYAQPRGNKRDAALDLAWALVNSSEFLYRH